MKLKQFTKIVAVGSFGSAFCFLASCKDAPKDSASQTEQPAKEAPAAVATTLPVYIATVSGSG